MMSSRSTFPQVHGADAHAERLVICPRCGGPLDVRVRPFYGQLEERCGTCRTPWALIPRRAVPRPPGAARRPRQPSPDQVEMRLAIYLDVLPSDAANALAVGDVAQVLGMDAYTVRRDLQRLARRQLLQMGSKSVLVSTPHNGVRRMEIMTFWRRAA